MGQPNHTVLCKPQRKEPVALLFSLQGKQEEEEEPGPLSWTDLCGIKEPVLHLPEAHTILGS